MSHLKIRNPQRKLEKIRDGALHTDAMFEQLLIMGMQFTNNESKRRTTLTMYSTRHHKRDARMRQ